MKPVDPGILPQSICFSFTPSDIAQELYFYPTWCGHYYCNSNYFIRRPSYPPLLLAYVRQGVFRVEYRGELRRAQHGDVLLLDCSEPHYYQAEDGLEFLYVHFDGSNAHALCRRIMETQGWHIQRENNPAIDKAIYDMVDFYQCGGIESAFESSMRIYRMFELLLSPTKQEQMESRPIDDAIQHIRSHYGEPLTLGELAAIARLSPCYFSHSFKRQTGFSPLEYVINTRIEQAKILLARTTRTVADIADEVGYGSGGSLTNLFLKRVGMSPKEFRKNHQYHPANREA